MKHDNLKHWGGGDACQLMFCDSVAIENIRRKQAVIKINVYFYSFNQKLITIETSRQGEAYAGVNHTLGILY